VSFLRGGSCWVPLSPMHVSATAFWEPMAGCTSLRRPSCCGSKQMQHRDVFVLVVHASLPGAPPGHHSLASLAPHSITPTAISALALCSRERRAFNACCMLSRAASTARDSRRSVAAPTAGSFSGRNVHRGGRVHRWLGEHTGSPLDHPLCGHQLGDGLLETLDAPRGRATCDLQLTYPRPLRPQYFVTRTDVA
jgi:hypothetical protein